MSFYQKLSTIQSTPATSDSQMTVLKAGDSLSFASEGIVYYTDDGSQPSFIRDEAGTILINGEHFRLGNSSMKLLGKGKSITVTEDWLQKEVITIRTIAYREGYDFSPVSNFRFKIEQEQAQAPSIKPVTTSEEPITINSGEMATLSTKTDGGVIVYTTNGRVPTYTVEPNGNSYQIVAGTNSHVYTNSFPITGEPGAEVTITAITVRINTSTGNYIMKDSVPVQFVYKITEREMAQAPQSSPESGTEISLNNKVYLQTTTSGGSILYTLDGTAPDYEVVVENNAYKIKGKGTTKIYGETVSYIEMKEPEAKEGQTVLIQAKTVKVDKSTGKKQLEDSAVVRFSFKITDAEIVATPIAIPETTQETPTIVSEGEKIILNCSTPGAKIYYTLDGTAPYIKEDGSLSGTTKLYNATNAVSVPEGEGFITITAIAVKEGMRDSQTAQFIYKYPDTVAPPYVSPTEGTVSVNTEVTLASLDENAQIYYTLDGSEPTVSKGRIYSEPILLTQNTIIKAICVVDGISSAVKTFTFYVAQELLPPSPSIATGAVLTSGTTIKLTAQNGAQIYYTTDGTSPKTDGAMAGDTVTITGKAGDTVTLMTYARGSNYSDSQMVAYVYTISNYENGIKINPAPGSKVKAGDVITMETDVTGGMIYYAVGGASPTSTGTKGTKVTVKENAGEDKYTLKATVVPQGAGFVSTVATYIYEFMEKPVAPKASIPDGAVLLWEQDVVLTAEAGDIYYTLDKTNPTDKSNLYAEAIKISEDTTIKAVSVSEEGAISDIATFGYTFAEAVKAPKFSIGGGEVESGTLLTITTDTPDATIYYTTDGQVPDLNNPKNLYIYSGAIALNKPVNIKAMAVKDRMSNSEVTSEIFTVKEPEIVVVGEEPEEEGNRKNGDRLMSRRSYMDNSDGPAYSDFVLKSAATGVVLSAQQDVIPAETIVEVVEIPIDDSINSAVKSSIGEEYGAVTGYDVTLVVGTERLQPQGDVELGLPIPEQYRNSAISIAYVDEDGNVEECETRRGGDMAYAHVSHLSRYCIVAPVDYSDKETSTDPMKVVAIIIVGLMIAGYLLLRIGRKKERESILDD